MATSPGDYDNDSISNSNVLPIDSPNVSSSLSLADANFVMKKKNTGAAETATEPASAVSIRQRAAKIMATAEAGAAAAGGGGLLFPPAEEAVVDVSSTSSSSSSLSYPSKSRGTGGSSSNKPSWMSKKKYCLVYLLLFAVVAGIAFVVGMAIGLKDGGAGSTTASSTTSSSRSSSSGGAVSEEGYTITYSDGDSDDEEDDDYDYDYDDDDDESSDDDYDNDYDDDDDYSSDDDDDDDDEDEGPLLPRHGRMQAIMYYLVKHKISSLDDMRAVDSAQYKALQWFVRRDGATLPVPATGPPSFHAAEAYLLDAYVFVFRYVMAVNYYALNGPNWINQMNFLSSEPVCDWNAGRHEARGEDGAVESERAGIRCNDAGIPVTLDLENNNLIGSIPSENGILKSLEIVDLEYNQLSGRIPDELCDLTELKVLQLQDNELSGTLPSCVSQWETLLVFRINENKMTGSLPYSICSWTHAVAVNFASNLFQGAIPACVGAAYTKIKRFSVSDNQLEGTVPNLSSWDRLEELYVDGNYLTGAVAHSVAANRRLEHLYLDHNEFTGEIDEFLPYMKQNLQAIDVSSNQFTLAAGTTLSPAWFQLPKLRVMDFSKNQLRGNLPQDIQLDDDESSSELFFLSLHENHLTGNIPTALFQKLPNLFDLDLSNNNFIGPMPEELFDMDRLRYLFLSENPNLDAGPIPANVESMTQLRELSCKNTNRVGPLPELLDFDNLFLLDFDHNSFQGPIPDNYGTLRDLRYLFLNRNPALTGTVPDFSGTELLAYILLEGTAVTGDFSSICNLRGFTGEIEFATGALATADCGDDDDDDDSGGGGSSSIRCDCCHCCSKSMTDEQCLDPAVGSFDWTHENLLARTSRDFAINYDNLDPPTSAQTRSSSDP